MSKKATLYRMVTPDHICPFGIKSRDLLKRKGYQVEDHHLQSREQTDDFKARHNVKTTPQTFIEGKRIGGYDDLRSYFGLSQEGPQSSTYTPVLALFAIAALLTASLALRQSLVLQAEPLILTFIAFVMVLLAVPKLQDLTAFSNQFITYDLIGMHKVRYAYFYPFAEAWAGLGMLAGLSAWAVAPVAIFIGSIGAISVVNAVYIQGRELKCACVGGDSNVPLGLLSLAENLFMLGAGLWMLLS